MGKAEYQGTFNAKGTAEKITKFAKGLLNLGGLGLLLEFGLAPVPEPAPAEPVSERTTVQNTTKPGRQARAATGGKRRRSALCASKANERFALRVTRT